MNAQLRTPTEAQPLLLSEAEAAALLDASAMSPDVSDPLVRKLSAFLKSFWSA